MKNLKLLNLFLLSVIIVSCSNDDSNDNPADEDIAGNYFPSTLDDTWTFEVTSESDDDANLNFSETDLLKIESVNGNEFTLEANNGAQANGVMSSFLVNGSLSKTTTMLEYDGSIDLPVEFSEFLNSEILLNDVILYDLNANNNSELSSNTGTINQDLDLGQTILPLTINYTFTSTKTGESDTEVVGGETYMNVTKSRLTLSVDVSTVIEVFGIQNTVSILDPQNVIQIDCQFAENVGLIEANSVQGYTLSSEIIDVLALANIDLGLPESLNVTNDQELDSYFVNLN